MDRLKAMTAFVEATRWQSLSRAAKELGTSRPLVSLQIKQLEEHVGARLINRTSRQFSLTDAGAEYLKFCKSILSQIEESDALISQLQGTPRGGIKVLSSLAFGNFELAPIAAAFVERYPQVSLSLLVTDNFLSRSQLVDQSFDVAFVMNPITDSATAVTTSVGAVRWLVCAAPSYLNSHEPVLTPADLPGHNCLSHRSFMPPGIWRFVTDGRTQEVAVGGNFFSNSVMVLRAGALQGLGIAMLPLFCIHDDLASGRLVQLLADHESPAKPVYAIYPHPAAPQKSRMFVEFCRRELQKEPIQPPPADVVQHHA